MADMSDLRETVHIDAPADVVYSLIADLPRMGEWSPECERVSWRGGATEAAKGAQFVGFNRAGTLRWITFGRIVAAERGRHLAFEIFVGPVQISLWEYFVVPDDRGDGCTLAEQWTDRRAKATRATLDRMLSDRVSRNRHGIRSTLAAVKRAAESDYRVTRESGA